MTRNVTIIALTTFALTSASYADIVDGIVHQYGRYVQAVDGFGAPDFNGYVVDLWLESDDATDTVLNVFNLNMTNSVGASSYYQSFTGGTWLPNNIGAPFETDALKHADSFVSIGGRNAAAESAYVDGVVVQMGPNGTGLDPNFGGTTAPAPGTDAGWYNSGPPTYIGQPVDVNGQLRVFIGRFALNGVSYFDLDGTISVAWNNGIGTPLNQAFELIIPAPGALALLGVVGFAGNRRRRVS